MVLDEENASSFVTFPNNYKINSIEIYINNKVKKSARTTKDILDVLSKIGGLFASLKVSMMLFVTLYSQPHLNSLYAHKLYTWTTPKSFKKEK